MKGLVNILSFILIVIFAVYCIPFIVITATLISPLCLLYYLIYWLSELNYGK